MTSIIIIALALLPVAILIGYILWKDRMAPEPTGLLLKAFGLGCLSTLLSFCLAIPFGAIGLYPAELQTVADSVQMAFFGAAVPEEVAKFFVLWLLLRRNHHFDERMDGIVYAVCVSLGFAALENILYLFGNESEFLAVGISRALTAVPGHCCFGILMGYFYSLAKFSHQNRNTNRAFILLAPILVHGLYDSLLMAMQPAPALSGILTVLFLVFCWKMWKQGHKRIQEHLENDMR